MRAVHHSCAYDGDIKTKYPPLSLSLSPPSNPPSRLRSLGPAPSNSPQASRNSSPPCSSVLNATTRGTFLPSLFSLSSQCRFAGWRGEVVERRKRERKLDEETAGGEKKTIEVSASKERPKRSNSLLVIGVPGRPQRGKRSRPPSTNCTPKATFPFIFSPLSFSPPRNRGRQSVWCSRFKPVPPSRDSSGSRV